jgi:cell division septum initiation protein DivIVA
VKDNRIKDRVNGLVADGPAASQPEPAPAAGQARPTEQPEAGVGDARDRLSLHMLTLAQRTAEEHIASAHQTAETIHAQAQATAERIVREAQARAAAELREAEEARSKARAAVEQMARDAKAQADQAQRSADMIISEARAQAEQIAADAQAQAEELDTRAQLRHEDFVGTLAAKQQAVQQQVQSLEQFDRDYRSRLVTFMRAQLRALGADSQHAKAGNAQPRPATANGPASPPQPASTNTTETMKAQQPGVG